MRKERKMSQKMIYPIIAIVFAGVFLGSVLTVFAHDTSAPKATTEKEAPQQVLIKNVNIFDGQNVLLEGNLKLKEEER